jgi:hypothetical protein
MRNRPPPGSLVWWRFISADSKAYRFGYCTYEHGHNLVRMGNYNGDTTGGQVVDADDIEWKPWSSQA